MTKITFYYNELNSTVKNSIALTKTNINSAIKKANNMYVPGGFRYGAYLNNLNEVLGKVNMKLSEISEWIDTSNSNYTSCINSLNDDISKIENIRIKPMNDSVIKKSN